MAACICSMEAAPSVAAVCADWVRPLAREAFSADWRVMPETESMELEVSSREEACSEAPEATAWEEAAIWVAAEETCSTASATWAIASWRAWAVPFTDSLMRAWSPWKLPWTRARRSRRASSSSTLADSSMGAITASSVWLTPSTIFLKSPWCFPASARVARRPSTAASASVLASCASARTASALRVMAAPMVPKDLAASAVS